MLVGCRRRGKDLRIDVYDTGVGIPQSKWRDIFVEFRRLDQGARIARGLGLGLSIVERVARVLDCKIELKSEAGRGSHFAVTVPLLKCRRRSSCRRAKTLASIPANSPASQCYASTTSLRCSMAWKPCCTAGDAQVLKAPDLAFALAAISESHLMPNGLLVDYHLDHGNGIEAIVALRRRYGDLPAILITADRSPTVREQAREAGIQVLHKPIKTSSATRAPGAMADDASRGRGVTSSAFCGDALRPLAGFNFGSGDDGLGAAFDAELLQNCRNMGLHRRLGDTELVGDLFV